MNVDTLKEKLADIDTETLRNFIFDLYLCYPELSDKIEALTLANDPIALSSVLRKRIASLKRGRRFIDYRASFDFARELEATLADIESGLLERSPEHAFDLVDRFLATAESVLNRVDDSGGAVGEVYRQAVLLWLTAASRFRSMRSVSRTSTTTWKLTRYWRHPVMCCWSTAAAQCSDRPSRARPCRHLAWAA
jgi:hypothetical protein